MDAGEYETNTLLISNLSAISFRIYEPIASQSSTYTFNASDVEDALRSNGHLVYMDAVRHGIWCFYLSSSDPAHTSHPELLGLHPRMEVCGYPLGLVGDGNLEPIGLLKNRPLGTNAINTPSSSSSTGSALDMSARSAQPFSFPPTPVVVDGKVASTPVGDVKGYGSVPAREIHEFFITAVLSSLTTYFCRAIGAILLNHRSVLLPSHAFNCGESEWTARRTALATFRTYLTTTGSLVISLHVSVLQGLVSSVEVLRSSLLHASPTVLAAPFGTFGALQGVVDTETQAADSGLGQSPDTQVSRLRSDHSDRFQQWKTTCCKLLQIRGMSPSLLDNCSWLNIHFLQRKPYEQRVDGRKAPVASSGPIAPWPAVLCFRKPKLESMVGTSVEKALSGTGADNVDPLSRARWWCKGASEREDAVARRKKERDAALAGEHVDTEARILPQASSYSPIGPWRSTNGGPPLPTGTMYLTPPEGVQPPGVVPSFDGGRIGTPAGPPVANAPSGAAPLATQQNAPAPDGFSVGWDGVEPRPEQTVNNFSEENLFGDLGENLFEGNELTDADFNFFDEQPVTVEMDLSGLPEAGTSTMAVQENMGQAFEGLPQTGPGTNENKRDVHPGSPQFMKPELRHSRSTLADESRQRTNMESFNLNSTVGTKRNPSPSNHESLFKRIRASRRPPPPSPSSQRGPPRRRSLFEKVDFDQDLTLVGKKYGEKGQFDYRSSALKEKENRALQNGGPLTTGRLLGSARQRRNLKELPSEIGSILTKLAGGAANSPRQRDDAGSESDDSTGGSDEDDASDRVGRASSPAKSSVIRRRPDDDVISMAASFRELDNISADSPGYGPLDLSRLSNSEIPEFSLSKYFADPEPVPIRISVSDEDFITVAQILTEQAASGFLKLAPPRQTSEIQDVRRSLVKAIRYSIRSLQKALPRSLAGAVGCPLRSFAEVQDVPLLVQPHGRVQVRPAELPKPSVFLIPAPHIELRRYENQLSVLPSAVSFWDTLGLGPAHGPKDVIAVCMLPQAEGMRDNATAFLDRVQSTYESLRLGAFERLSNVDGLVDGVILLPVDQDIVSSDLSLPFARSAYVDKVASLAMALSSAPMSGKNFVVYVAYTPENPSSIVDACSSFQEVFEHYKRCMMDRKKQITNELVLQLVPLDVVASETSLVVMSPSECTRLCLETYDRCTLFGGPMPAPAIMLERALPRGIDFKLAATPSPNLLRENSCIHVAYARSVDERWVTTAWTDNRGSTQATASYCLGRRGKPLSRQLAEVVHEIWETTHDLISTCKVHWRVVITKCGPMDQQEMELWIGMAQAETRATVSLVLLTVDTDPSLQLIPPVAAIPLSAPAAFYTTPVSTPQPLSGVSPDQNNPSTPLATPGGAGGDGGANPAPSSQQPQPPPQPELQDGDTTLVDTTETTWGVVVSHRLNNSPSLTELNPALASGYLIKRAGPRAEDPPVAMEVNVVYSDNARAMYDGLLREMLTYFRGLGTLARVRGMVEKEVDVRPWHVAAVEKAVRVLYLLM
ncbi:mediator complex subunit 13 C-terminal-domain-containing protein [Achaetomium macrosporum]|uniref:Mediator of RNA polymerase II transcription subunit 13 n=1 Tax=Achaetomium macrosporum TaxID=79813 RepID=A0AAN7CG42_9PEZI|nr:mediator complex subunit 13 C-terminal-domain-containing protein [Achaetomium macrosporum]